MRIAGVDIPQALIEAQRTDNLVIFVGAGASRSSPSDLPDFATLARQIATDSGRNTTEEELKNADVLLGDLEDHYDVDVHKRVAELIGSNASRPNSLHQAIAVLAAVSPEVRIVTTNYDLHLSEALTAEGVDYAEEAGPALPLGDDFAGVVYLHGRLGHSARRLVVTDADFGQAYLRDAWATRFLDRMFSRYTVLFIGYSHRDIVVTYLARGLRADSRRFVLTDEPDSPHWRRLKITPVGYPNPDGSYRAQTDAIRGWATWVSMGLLDHQQQVARLVAAPPSQIPEEMSYLVAVLRDSSTVEFFTQSARGPEWLSWAAGQDVFRPLFSQAQTNSASTRALASWVAECYMMQEDLSDLVWALAGESGGIIGPDLWDAIGSALHRRQGPRPDWLSRWLVLMVQNVPRSPRPWLEYALMKSAWPLERPVALLLFDYLTEPDAAPSPSFAVSAGTRMEIRLHGEQWPLQEAWTQVFAPHLDDAAHDLIIIADRHLRRAHALLTATGAARPGWDPLSFSRSAIDPHDQDDMPEPTDFLIDAARDCLERLLDTDSGAGMAYLVAWADADPPLLRRLAVNGWAHRDDVDAAAKLEWLMSRDWLFDHQLRHEVFALIASTVSRVPAELADALVAEAAAGPPGEEDHDYEAYNVLAWITQHAPELESARAAFRQAQDHHPGYRVRAHPDLMAWLEDIPARPQLPMRPADLHDLLGADPAAAIAELRERISASQGWDWEDGLSLIADTIRQWPDDGVALANTDAGSEQDILGAITQGWGAAVVTEASAEAIVDRLARADLAAAGPDIARLLAGTDRPEGTPTAWHRLPAARLLAASVWAATPGTSSPASTASWLSDAISHPAGQLAQFWVKAIAADWRAADETWSGLPEATREQLEAMLGTGDHRGVMAEIIFASQLHFFSVADSAWCLSHIFPLLSWAAPACAERTWNGFLAWGRFNDQLLTAGLLQEYIQAAVHMAQLPETLHRQLYRHLSAVALHKPDASIGQWAQTLTFSVDVPIRTAWMNQVGWDLSLQPPEAVEQHWATWMRAYWDDRLGSVPRNLDQSEASAMAAWVAYLTTSLEEGITKAISVPAGITQYSRLLQDLTGPRIRQAPSAIATFVTHLLKHTMPPFHECDQVQRITQELGDTPGTEAIAEQALRLRCT